MKKRESMLWQRIKKNCRKAHLIRVESNTINGIPDINGCWSGKEFWMELKSDKVGYPKLSKWQIAWINKRIKHRGIVISAELRPELCRYQWPAVQRALWSLLQDPVEARSRSLKHEQRIAKEIERHQGSVTSQDLSAI